MGAEHQRVERSASQHADRAVAPTCRVVANDAHRVAGRVGVRTCTGRAEDGVDVVDPARMQVAPRHQAGHAARRAGQSEALTSLLEVVGERDAGREILAHHRQHELRGQEREIVRRTLVLDGGQPRLREREVGAFDRVRQDRCEDRQRVTRAAGREILLDRLLGMVLGQQQAGVGAVQVLALTLTEPRQAALQELAETGVTAHDRAARLPADRQPTSGERMHPGAGIPDSQRLGVFNRDLSENRAADQEIPVVDG